MNLSYIGGQAIQVNGKNVIEDGSNRARAIWESALAELENADYVNALNHNREMSRSPRQVTTQLTSSRNMA